MLRPIARLPKALQDRATVFLVAQALGEVVRTIAMVRAGTTSVTIVVVQLVASTTKREETSPKSVSFEALPVDELGC